MHDYGDGRLVVPLLAPGADDLPFAVALEMHQRHQPGRCTNPSAVWGQSNSFQLQYILQGSAELVQNGQSLGEVQAGDSVLMSSGTAQCQVSNEDNRNGSQPQWHLAALTLTLGVCPELEFNGFANTELEPAPVDCSVAQKVADVWSQLPVVGILDDSVVAELVACAQSTAQDAVSSQPRQPTSRLHDEELSIATADSSSSEEAAAEDDRMGSALSQASGTNIDSSTTEDNGTFSAAVPTAGNSAARLWQEGPAALSMLLQRLWKRKATEELIPPEVRKRRLRELHAFTLPGQSNRLALVFNPLDDIGVPFTFGLEIFERNHQTPPHSHSCAHELFFILSGSGSAFCDGRRFAVHPGDVVVFPPTSVHGIDNGSVERLFCLELMLPNEMFAELVRKGIFSGALSQQDLCTLAAEECGYVKN